MKNIRTLATAASLLVVGCVDQPAVAPLMPTQPSPIISGDPDQGAHPYVGLVVFDDADGPAWRCSGALLSSTVVVTAGHCTDGAVAARIWMDENVEGNTQYPNGGTTSYEGTPHTYPGFCVLCTVPLSILNLIAGDVGIVVLSEPVPTNVVSTYAQLPAAGLVSTLANGSTIQIVGYGDQVMLVGGGPPGTDGLLVRLKTNTTLISGTFYNSENVLRLSATSSRDRGTSCFGDSGGPNLVGNSNVTVGVVSYGTNRTCMGVSYTTRIDVPSILSWIQSF